VLRRESVLREYMLEFIHQFAPHLDRRDVARAVASDEADIDWPDVPPWKQRARVAAQA
jgi:hypothetical protein